MLVTNDNSSQVPAIINDDYKSFFINEHLRFLSSSLWKEIESSFRRELQLRVAPGDYEVLSNYLREERTNCLEKFKQSDCYYCWKKSFNSEENRFDEILFIKKLSLLNDNNIELKDLNDFFTYYCLTNLIESGLKKILDFSKSNYGGTFNIFINQGEIRFEKSESGKNEEKDETDVKDDILKNIIFNSKLFDTNDRLLRLREIIAHSIDMDDYNDLFGKPNNSLLDPAVKGEWYYILKAIEEAEVAKRVAIKNFLMQMDSWFPWLFTYNNLEEMQIVYRKLEKSISHEKSLWKIGKAKDIVKLKDMWARINSLNMDYSKAERIYNAAYNGLCVPLEKYKHEIEKGKVI